MIAKPSGYDDAWLQVLMIVMILREKNQGIPSSGIKFCFWGALVIYASIKLHTLIFLSRDQMCIYKH